VVLLPRLRPPRHGRTTRLATTIETWWPAIHVALTEQVTNARTEGFNRIIKQVKRIGCGFRTMDNYHDASWPTSQSSDREDKRHDQAAPLKCREPKNRHRQGSSREVTLRDHHLLLAIFGR
jgi:hypothetical protein